MQKCYITTSFSGELRNTHSESQKIPFKFVENDIVEDLLDKVRKAFKKDIECEAFDDCGNPVLSFLPVEENKHYIIKCSKFFICLNKYNVVDFYVILGILHQFSLRKKHHSHSLRILSVAHQNLMLHLRV